VAILTGAASWLAWRQWRRNRVDGARPGNDGPLTVALSWQRPVTLTRDEQARVRRELLGQVRRTWISGVLERSLAQVARLELGLVEQPGAVAHPWGTLLHQPGQPPQPLPPGTTVSAIAGRFDAHLLILGAPGAGKTTLLLEYARDLLDQADGDPHAPMPVVFHLSAWPAEPPSLAGWLAEELGLRYGLPKRVAGELVERDRLAVLLDGLDEVPAEQRIGCVEAINTFRAAHGGMPLVVCARTRQYQELADQLRLGLNGTVEVQPLDRAQIRAWLQAAGRPLAGLRSALRDSRHWLWGLLDTPLWLSITALTYNGQPARAIRAHGSEEVLLAA
jgi:eukaryotic-like serine/threonine-protein kinase